MTDDERAIRTLVQTWMDASKAGDHQAVLNLMTDDAVFMVPGKEPFGKDVFQAATHAQQNFKIDGTSDIREIKILGDWAYISNYLEMKITPAQGEPITKSGYTLTLLRKEADGQWRLMRDANLLV